MVTVEQLAARRDAIVASPDLAGLADHLSRRNAPVLERMPPVPEVKALLSAQAYSWMWVSLSVPGYPWP